jgi:succinyl-diaminopimelate desuccinylase
VEAGCQGSIRVTVRVRGRRAHVARSWKGVNAIHDAGKLLATLAAYEPRTPTIDGCEYREALNAVKIRGGVAGNVVPDLCEIDINHRFAPDRTAEQAQAYLRDLFAGYELDVLDIAPAAPPGLSAAPAREFVTAVGSTPIAKLGWTDVARFAALGIPAVNFGPGDPNLAHAPDEHVEIGKITEGAAVLRRWLGGMPAAVPPGGPAQ